MDEHHVGDLEYSGLFPLEVVAGLWLQEQNDRIGQVANPRIALAGPHRLKQDHLKPKGFQKGDHQVQAWCYRAAIARRGQAANEHTVIGLRAHTKAITQERAAAPGALGVAGEHCHRLATSPDEFDQFADQGALADTGTARDRHHAAALCRSGQAGSNGVEILTARSQRQQPCQRGPVAPPKAD